MNLRDWKLRLRALVMPRRVERDLHDELSFHIERETKKLIDEGMEPARARDTAQARFGSTTVAADECRDERGTAFVDNTIRDVHYALRTFRRAPLASHHDRGHRRDRSRRRGGPLHDPEYVPVPGRHGPRHHRDVRRRTAAAGQWRSIAPDASAVRSIATRDQRLHRCVCGAVRHRPARRRPDDGGHARLGQFLPGRRRQ